MKSGCRLIGAVIVISVAAGAQELKTPTGSVGANLRSGALNLVAAPDLVVTGVRQDPPDPVLANQRVTFTVTVRNQGSAIAVFPPASRFISQAGISRANSSGNAASIGPGQTSSFVFNWLFSGPGTFKTSFKVDPDNVVAESNESNNERSESYTIVGGGTPDLIIESIAVEPAQPMLMDDIRLNVTIRNQGSGVASIGAGRILESVGTNTVSVSGSVNLAPGATETRLIRPKQLTAGTHEIRVVVDPGNAVGETNELNNAGAVTVRIASLPSTARPDLAITAISLDPPNPAVTDTWRFAVTLQNQGNWPIQIAPGIQYVARRYPSQSDWVGITSSALISIPPGGTYVGHLYPGTGSRVGTNTIYFRADPENAVPESDESDNEKSVSFTLR